VNMINGVKVRANVSYRARQMLCKWFGDFKKRDHSLEQMVSRSNMLE
jgi:hypothetical protein